MFAMHGRLQPSNYHIFALIFVYLLLVTSKYKVYANSAKIASANLLPSHYSAAALFSKTVFAWLTIASSDWSFGPSIASALPRTNPSSPYYLAHCMASCLNNGELVKKGPFTSCFCVCQQGYYGETCQYTVDEEERRSNVLSPSHPRTLLTKKERRWRNSPIRQDS
ncbi:unnamed protein product [Protopolystoma xenopodis]|uniref:EGF-like domain-containing protein n=1 Tax=Protopolystoma xenopodis TaxID=117903 RepID=A0A3S5CIS7_9PLAT|nr:unnamed protein product [Protopolystoma xenopodis]